MVNYGVSRGCLTCKTRRIKCDEARPVCRRCTKSKRTCLQNNADVIFREDKSKLIAAQKRAGKLTPPSSVSPPGPESVCYEQSIDESPEDVALRAFLHDYVLVSKDRNLSRGYFDGLKELLHHAGPTSTLARAITMVAAASASSKRGSDDLSRRSAEYPAVLAAFKETLENPAEHNADEALMTAVLLGLYEVIVAGEAYPMAHGMHLSGVSAILCSRSRSFEVLELSRYSLFELFNPLVPRRPASNRPVVGLLSPYASSETDPPTRHLDGLLIKSRPILERASLILSNTKASKADLRALKQAASLLNKEFALWPLSSQPDEWMPQRLGVMTEGPHDPLHETSFWPGMVESYYDLYVAAVWNIYRKGRLKLMDVIIQCSEQLQSLDQHHSEISANAKLKMEMQKLVDDLCASIPFHLVSDLRSSLQAEVMTQGLETPGQALGGLLLMYPLYIAASLPVVPKEQRLWMQGRLRWIGEQMGIRQATMLANNVLGVSHKLVGIGHSLVFAGSLMEPKPQPNTLS